ncbi:Z1 domain-containing protein [Nocardia sp. BMG111209]|uniref:Z1 domain-containing protein n=1 Tax=Nocardia sp. BMG111209 TaxID=1160137 RepID=UPI0003636281|nr:Z1 domain-containing protein [Nocardia sp. BMG111209]
MVDPVDDQYDVFRMLLDATTPDDAVKRLAILGVDRQTIEKIRERHERDLIQIREMEEPRSVVLDNRYTWYTGPRPDDRCWPALVRILEKDGWSKEPAISSLDASTTRIVSLLNHPHEKAFTARGLVVGYVQSGKTTNFTATMAKAADRGYKLFIVLAGIHNGLRRQTQARLIQQLVEPNPADWTQITQLDHDFTPTANPASYFGKSNKTHVLCVVKKNAPVLRKLVKWLDDASDYLADTPTLVIDDEADQATVASRTINPLIQKLLATLPKVGYVGYTASPFANLLINPSAEDLYPKDFIVNLPKPEGHFGTEVLFGRYALDGEDPTDVDDGYDMIRTVPQDDVASVRPLTKADAEDFEPVLTESLRQALEYFWMGTAARRVRGTGNPHSTMLIHTSVRTSVHLSFRQPLEALRSKTVRCLQEKATIERLRMLWDSETARVPAVDFDETPVTFDQLMTELPGVLRDCRVIMDNSFSTDRLDYENGPVVAIAVGGNTLSRGLTLEGLLVSYFVRAVSIYDTLLQMGRWFGYRRGYEDLPRIWMTDELKEWFRHLATVETEMRKGIDIYLTEDKTPLQFAVRLRTHPALRVTAAAKMQDAVRAQAGYGGQRIQTRYFHKDSAWLINNQRAAQKLVTETLKFRSIDEESEAQGRYLFRDVPSNLVLDFIENYQFHEKSQECNGQMLSRYIRARNRNGGALRRWNLAIVGNPVTPARHDFSFATGVSVGRIVRAAITASDDFADIKTLMSRRDAALDLAGDISNMDEKEIKKQRTAQLPDTGLLVLYPIDKESKPERQPKPNASNPRTPLDAPEHVIGVGLVFPQPAGPDSTVPWEADYISADLSGVEVEEIDYSAVVSEDMA